MPQFAFGGGTLYALRTDIAGATPVRFGALQDVQLDFSGDLKELYGQGQYPLALARGKSKIEGKAKFAQINGGLFNALYFGQTANVAQLMTAQNEALTVPGGGGGVGVANAAGFQTDLGLVYAGSGLTLTKVAANPSQGQYVVSTPGHYTLAAGDGGVALLASYTYSGAAGIDLTLTNTAMGQAPVFQAVFVEQYGGKQLTLQLNACVASKLSLPTKQDDWSIVELDFQAQADAAGNIGSLSLTE